MEVFQTNYTIIISVAIVFFCFNFLYNKKDEKLLNDLLIDLSAAIIVELVVSLLFETSLQ